MKVELVVIVVRVIAWDLLKIIPYWYESDICQDCGFFERDIYHLTENYLCALKDDLQGKFRKLRDNFQQISGTSALYFAMIVSTTLATINKHIYIAFRYY